jgi:hypothetical protein
MHMKFSKYTVALSFALASCIGFAALASAEPVMLTSFSVQATEKYADTILAPWGATKASGIIYITTAKKINQLACKEALTLNENELSTISSYEAHANAQIAAESVSASQYPGIQPTQTSEADPVVTYPSDPDAVQNASLTGPSLTATAVLAPGASLISKFQYFLENLF